MNKIIAELKVTKAELAVDKAVSALLEARRAYDVAYSLVIANHAERVEQ